MQTRGGKGFQNYRKRWCLYIAFFDIVAPNRLNNIVARRATSAEAASNNTGGFPVTGRVAPTDADAAGFHLVNVFVHALTCGWSVFLFRGVFSGNALVNRVVKVASIPKSLWC